MVSHNTKTLDTYKEICNAIGCNELANCKKSISIGNRNIDLVFCSKCIFKFSKKEDRC